MPCNIPWPQKVWHLSEHGHSSRMCTPCCLGIDVGTLQQMYMCQATVPNSKACKHDFFLPGEAGELPHRKTWLHCPQPVILCVGPQVLPWWDQRAKKWDTKITTQRLFWWQTLKENSFTAFTVSLLSRPTELDSLQKASPHGGGKPDVPVCVWWDSTKQ